MDYHLGYHLSYHLVYPLDYQMVYHLNYHLDCQLIYHLNYHLDYHLGHLIVCLSLLHLYTIMIYNPSIQSHLKHIGSILGLKVPSSCRHTSGILFIMDLNNSNLHPDFRKAAV